MWIERIYYLIRLVYFICGLGGFEFLFGLGVVWGELDEYGVFCGGEWWGEGGFVEFIK